MKQTNEQAYEEAQTVIPGGVNSPVRAFQAVGGTPPFMERGEGAYLYDIESNKYIDCVMSYGPLILGHTHPAVHDAVTQTLARGTSFGAPTTGETELARRICEAIPSVQKVRLVNSGTEATMSAVRIARAVTGRSKIIKCEGCYHGHADSFLIKAGSGALTLSLPGSPGVPESFSRETLIAQYNDADSVSSLLDNHADETACIIVEPVAGNMGVIPPDDGYLEKLRELADRHNVLLIFDEVMTGFRVSYNGAQGLYGVMPDLTTLGKIIGGGFPIGAVGGRADYMDYLSPAGSVYQAGTLSGNPVAVSAGIAMLDYLKKNNPYDALAEKMTRLCTYITDHAAYYSLPVTWNSVGSMGTCFFNTKPVHTFSDAAASDTTLFARFHQLMRAQGIYLAPAQFEAIFLSTAHSNEDIDRIGECVGSAFKQLVD